jgi:hypothetical protein
VSLTDFLSAFTCWTDRDKFAIRLVSGNSACDMGNQMNRMKVARYLSLDFAGIGLLNEELLSLGLSLL